MEFHVLGPVELLRGDAKVSIKRAKTRHVLGVLLLAQGRPVTTETMMNALWDDRPNHVRKDLQSYVSRLRHTLRAAQCTARVISHDGSYVLEAPDDEIDYDRSTALLDKGRQAKQQGHLDDAAALLEGAVQLWNGPPIQSLNTRWMELRREELEFQLASCWQARIEVELLRRHYSEALKMVEQVIPDHEFDKAFITQKLIALNGCGRYDKFDSYWQQIWQSQIRAFGTQPDSDLQELQVRLLQERDGHYAVAPPVTVIGNPLPAPAQLPPQSADFVGRDEELGALDEALGRTRARRPTALPVLAIVGGVATGKSALAVEWSHNNRRHSPDGQLCADLHGFDHHPRADPFDVLADFLIALGLSQDQLPDTTEQRTALFRSVVDGRQLLVLLDNARDSDQVRPLLPGSSSCVVVVTSRSRLRDLVSHHAARRITIGALTDLATTAFLRHGVERDRLARESTALSAVADLCGNLPGLLRVVTDVLVDRPHLRVEDFVAELRRSEDDILPFGGGETGARTVGESLSWSYDALSPATARTFRLISLHFADEFGVGDAAALADTTVEETEAHLHALWSIHLLKQTSHQRYHLHGLELAFARRRLRLDHGQADRAAALRRLLDWYLRTSTSAVRAVWSGNGTAVDTFSSARTALLWLRTEHLNLTAAVREANDLGVAEAWLLPLALHPHHVHAECLAEWHDAYSTALRAARAAAADHSAVTAHLALAASSRALGAPGDAAEHLVHALATARRLGLDHEESTALRELGMLAHRSGDSTAGLAQCEAAHRVAVAARDRAGEAAALHCVGLIRSDLREHGDAILAFDRALLIREDLGLRIEFAATSCELGLAHLRLHDHDQAFAHCGRVVDIDVRHTVHRTDLARALLVLGEVEHRRGNHFKALTHLHGSLALCHPLHDRASAAHALDLLGTSFLALGQGDNANEEWQQALLLLTDLDDPHAEHVQAQIAHLTASSPEDRAVLDHDRPA